MILVLLADYHVGSTYGWSQIFRFTAMKAGTDWSPKLLVFGDMGNENAKALGRIQEEAEKGLVDAVMHVGNLHTFLCNTLTCTTGRVLLYDSRFLSKLQRNKKNIISCVKYGIHVMD